MLQSFSRLLTLALIAACMSAPSQAREPGELYPELKPFKQGYLEVSDIHSIWYGLFGNPQGKPVFVLHGGPGAGSYPRLTQYFNPEKFLIVLHDQRGAGISKPAGEIRENTIWDLVDDINRLRDHLGFKDKMLVFGGSWGSCLALAYSEKYPQNVSGLVLRGVFTGSAEEIENVCGGCTVSMLFPDAVARLQAALPPGAEISPQTMYDQIVNADPETSQKVSEAWARYAIKTSTLNAPDEKVNMDFGEWNIRAGCRIDVHYLVNKCFLEPDQLIRDAERLKDIPVTLINGRFDLPSPPRAAYRLHQCLPKSKLFIIEEAGHSETEPAITRKLVEAVAEFE